MDEPEPTERAIDTKVPLGALRIPEHTFSYDQDISDKYQVFSAEILRLALLGIGAIGYLITNMSAKTGLKRFDLSFKVTVSTSLLLLGFSALFALAHRYFAVDSMSSQLRLIRLTLRARPDDLTEIVRERSERNKLLHRAKYSLYCSSILLGSGALTLASGFILLCADL